MQSGARITLSKEQVIGRASRSTLHLDDPRVSGQHALLRWRDGGWTLRDLGSSNGTSIDDVPLEPGRQVSISRGAVLTIGGKRQRWRMIDDGPPVVAAHQLERDETVRAADGLLGIPDPEAPEATLFRHDNGDWILEHGDDVLVVKDQHELTLAGGVWQLWLPHQGDATDTTRNADSAPRVLRLATLRFGVSRDGEYIELDVISGTETLPMGARSHNEMLLAMARVRLADRDNPELGHADKGWMYTEQLCDELGVEPDQLNILVFRARKQLRAAGIDNGAELIERRPSNRQLRLGTDRVVIEPLA